MISGGVKLNPTRWYWESVTFPKSLTRLWWWFRLNNVAAISGGLFRREIPKVPRAPNHSFSTTVKEDANLHNLFTFASSWRQTMTEQHTVAKCVHVRAGKTVIKMIHRRRGYRWRWHAGRTNWSWPLISWNLPICDHVMSEWSGFETNCINSKSFW